MNELKYQYGAVRKRSIWGKIKMVLTALWFIPVLGCCILWDYFFGDKE